LSLCARTFGAVLELADLNLSIFQDTVSIGSNAPELHPYLPNAVVYLLDMSSQAQRDMEGFGRWYHEMLDLVVFGTEDDPIFIDE
jgi:hypothetical protein